MREKIEIRIAFNSESDPIDMLMLYNELRRIEVDDIRLDANQCIIELRTGHSRLAVQQQVEMFLNEMPIALGHSVNVY